VLRQHNESSAMALALSGVIPVAWTLAILAVRRKLSALGVVSVALFAIGVLSAQTQTIAWMVIFFFASPAASAAYLTVSEIFPLEIRALAIAVFYSAGTAVGGIVAPWFFGMLIDTGSREALFGGYMIAVALMLTAAIVEAVLGVPAERKSLEQIAAPLSSL